MRLWHLIVALVALAPTMAMAQAACPEDVNAQISALTEQARQGEVGVAELGEAATRFVKACGDERVMLSQILAMFTAAGIATEPPSAERFQAHLFAFRTVGRIERAGGGDFAPIHFTGRDGTTLEWGVLDERDAYWDLMFAMSSDHLIYGVHGDLYTPGKTESIGCGLYPDEEASALARQAEGNLDGGELVVRVSYLGRACDTEGREVSGYAARYFAAHAKARTDDPAYTGLTESDIRAGLNGFLDRHLDGAGESWLFDADEVAALRAY